MLGPTCLQSALTFAVPDAGDLTGFSRWTVETFNAHPRLYALGCVVALLAVGAGMGLLTDLVLHRLQRGDGPTGE